MQLLDSLWVSLRTPALGLPGLAVPWAGLSSCGPESKSSPDGSARTFVWTPTRCIEAAEGW